jgi:DNA-binding XRE family transcriptional regulator
MTRWMVELDYASNLGVLSEREVDTLTAIDHELAEAAVGQHPGRGLSVSIEVEAPSAAAAEQIAEERVVAALTTHELDAGQVIASTVQTLAAFEAEQVEPNYPELVSAAEAAETLGVTRQRVHQLHREHPQFPAPLHELRTGPLWVRAGMEAFAARWVRKPGRGTQTTA